MSLGSHAFLRGHFSRAFVSVQSIQQNSYVHVVSIYPCLRERFWGGFCGPLFCHFFAIQFPAKFCCLVLGFAPDSGFGVISAVRYFVTFLPYNFPLNFVIGFAPDIG